MKHEIGLPREFVVLRDIQNLTGHGPEQRALAGPALTMGLD